jgi:hypothetical protein
MIFSIANLKKTFQLRAIPVRIAFLLTLSSLFCCQGFIDYGKNRVFDFFDCFKVNAGYGLGLTLDFKVTDWLAPGLGYMSYSKVWGWENRERSGYWEEWVVINTPRGVWELSLGANENREGFEAGISSNENKVARLALASVFLANERWLRDPGSQKVVIELYSLFNFAGISNFIRVIDPREKFLGIGEFAEIKEKKTIRKGFFEVGATVGVFHGRFGVNPFEIFDFLLGFVGIDFPEDDL